MEEQQQNDSSLQERNIKNYEELKHHEIDKAIKQSDHVDLLNADSSAIQMDQHSQQI